MSTCSSVYTKALWKKLEGTVKVAAVRSYEDKPEDGNNSVDAERRSARVGVVNAKERHSKVNAEELSRR